MAPKVALALSLVFAVACALPGSVSAQDANPYSGAAGFLYSQGRVAAPGQTGGPVPLQASPQAPALDSLNGYPRFQSRAGPAIWKGVRHRRR